MKTLLILSLCLASCTAPQYVINTKPYADQIAANPEAVVVESKDVTPVGGFQMDFGVVAETDYGIFGVDNDGVSGDLVIDLTSGK